jgi:NADPH2:quinone reductase
MIPETMRALQVADLSGPAVVTLTQLPVPSLRPGHVLVKVAAGGINYGDVAQTRGLYIGGPRPPYVPGVEAAGTVVAVGEGVHGLAVGQRVMAMGARAFAEYALFPAATVMPTPEGWTDAQAASMPVQWLTAHGCLRTVGRLEAGETVLIHAVAGGVGLAALRLAKHFGATVIGTASSQAKLDVARARGLDLGIDYVREDFAGRIMEHTDGRGVDLVLEMVGGQTFRDNLKVVRPYGRVVVFGAASNESARIDNVRLIFSPIAVMGYHITVLMEKRPDLFAAELAEFQALIDAGIVKPEPPSTWPIEQAAAALIQMESRQTTGKQVLLMG